MDDEDTAVAALLLAVLIRRKRRKRKEKKKRIWCHEWYRKRVPLADEFKDCIYMSKPTFDELLNKLAPLITKRDTAMREAICPQDRLALTLRFLTSGKRYDELKSSTAIAPHTIARIVMETCEAIISQLKDFIKLPETQEDWRKEANDFNALWNFPNCLGVIDGRHVKIIKPHGSGKTYFNYKRNFSIILMAVVNANHEFLMVDIGTNGTPPGALLSNEAQFLQKLKRKTFEIPEPETLPGCEEKMPFVFVAGDVMPLSENIMRRFSHQKLTEEEIIFNSRICEVHKSVENTFGILTSRFRILLQSINLSPQKVTTIISACCYLHNFLKRKNESAYLEGAFDLEDTESGEISYADWRGEPQLQELRANISTNAPAEAEILRKKFCNYFSTRG